MLSDFPDDDNGDALRRMQAGGDDFSKLRTVDFSVVFPSKRAAEDFASRFRQLGHEVSVEESDSVPDLPWDVTVKNHMALSHSGISEFEDRLEATANPLGGRNDGWGCFRQTS